MNCYIWRIALYGVDKLTLLKVGSKYFRSFEMWCWLRKGRLLGSIEWEMKY